MADVQVDAEVVTDLPEKVYTENDARLFVARGELCSLTTPWYDTKGLALQFENPVELFDPDLNRVGFASLFKDGGALAAFLFFRYDCPERLNIEFGTPVYVVPLGEAVVENITDLESGGADRVLNGGPLKLVHLSITGVKFSDTSTGSQAPVTKAQ